MLKLKCLARENQIGPLYCSLSRNHMIGIDVDTSDDEFVAVCHSEC